MNDDIRIDSNQPDSDAWQAREERRKHRAWIAIGLGFVLVLSLLSGYRVGADLAKRDNHRDCVAAGGVDCQRG